MRRARMGSVVLAAAGFLSPVALGQDQPGQSGKSGTPQGQSQSPAQSQRERAPDGFVLIEERVIVLTANEPQNHFLRAGELFLAGNSKAAAGEVRMAANYLDMQSSRATDEAKQQLSSAAQELRSAAKQLQERTGQRAQQSDRAQEQQQSRQQVGQQQDQRQEQAQRQQRMQQQMQGQAKELLDAFARANYALAQHFQSKAQAAVENDRPVIAGHELAAAADSLIAAVAWTGQQPPQEALQAVAKAQQLAGRLAAPDEGTEGAAQQAGARQGAGGDIPRDAKQVVQDLGKAVESCGQSIRSSSSGPAQQASDEGQQNQKQ